MTTTSGEAKRVALTQLLTVWLCRFTGSIQTLAFIAVVMPRSWMEIAHEGLGLGAMAESTVLMFLIRHSSYVYAMHGVALWVLSFDLERFRPVILFLGMAYTIAGFVYLGINVSLQLPLLWTIFDSGGCFGFGVGVLGLQYMGRSEKQLA